MTTYHDPDRPTVRWYNRVKVSYRPGKIFLIAGDEETPEAVGIPMSAKEAMGVEQALRRARLANT